MDDYISREAAIAAVHEHFEELTDELIAVVNRPKRKEERR